GRWMARLDHPADIEAVHVREPHIEHDDVRPFALDLPQPFIAARCLADAEAGAAQHMRFEVAVAVVVIDDEDRGIRRNARGGHTVSVAIALSIAAMSAAAESSDFDNTVRALPSCRCCSAPRVIEVSTTAGTAAAPCAADHRSRNWKPSMVGMLRSTSTTSGRRCAALSSASWPVAASLTSKPLRGRSCRTRYRATSSSSTTRTRRTE